MAGKELIRDFCLDFLATIGAAPLVQNNKMSDIEQNLRQFAALMCVKRAQIHVLFATTSATIGNNIPYILRFAEFLAIAFVPFLPPLLA